MTVTNAYFREVDQLLTYDSKKPYINVNFESKISQRTNLKPKNFKVIDFISLLNETIKSKSEERKPIALTECKERIELLTNIEQRSNELFKRYKESISSPRRKFIVLLSQDYESEYSLSLLNTENRLRELIKTIDNIRTKAIETYRLGLIGREMIKNIDHYTDKSIDELTIDHLISNAALALELAIDPENESWGKDHAKMLNTLYDSVIKQIKQGQIASEDITFIADASEKLISILSPEKVWHDITLLDSKGLNQSVRYNKVKFEAYADLISNGNQEGSQFVYHTVPATTLLNIQEHFETGMLDNIEKKQLSEILLILNSHYFQHFPNIIESCIAAINGMKLGVFITINQKQFTVKLLSNEGIGGTIHLNPFIVKMTTHLDLGMYSELIDKPVEETSKLFRILIDKYQEISTVSLPAPCSLNEESIFELTQRNRIKQINLNFSLCKNIKHFEENFSHLCHPLNQQNWKLKLCHIDHLSTADAVKILSYFPLSHSLCIDDKNFLTDDNFHSLACNLPNIQKLSMQNLTKITDKSLAQLTKHSVNITHLWLSGCHQISDKGVCDFLSAHGEKITLLHLDSCNITPLVAFTINIYCQSLTSLSFANCQKIDDHSINAIANGCPKIKYLNLNKTNITDTCCELMISNLKSLREISFYGCPNISESAINLILANCPDIDQIDRRGTAIPHKILIELRNKYPNILIK
ncbi:MAG: hypothetical protein VX777_06710 [Chlamydiota bacterium]|nr:hypothetical protein [Chlamydiota bacterium]